MELVSASKMRRAVRSVLLSRAYSNTAWSAVQKLSQRVEREKHILLSRTRAVKSACYILLASNRGLCGGFNAKVISVAFQHAQNLEKRHPGVSFEWIALGKKAAEALARTRRNMTAEFSKPDVVSGISDILSLARMVKDFFRQRKYDRVFIAYTDYVSALAQKPRIFTLLPFETMRDEELGAVRGEEASNAVKKEAEFSFREEYAFEPAADMVLDFFLSRIIDIELYQSLLESTASEHAARMLAMRQATDAASDMIDELTLVYNQARQASITREIAEISSGKAALE